MIETREPGLARHQKKPESIREWRSASLERRALPIIMIAGSRGKTTVSRLVELMVGDQYKIATRSPDGVAIRGERQAGEIEPWSRVERMLQSGELDLAIWEVDWPTASTLQPTMKHSVLAITNVCANRDACMIYGDAKIALRSLPVLMGSLPEGGTLVLNGEDLAISSLHEGREATTVLAGMGIDAPEMETHWQAGGVCAWVESDFLCIGHNRGPVRLARTSELKFALSGMASFEVHNALMAASIGYSIGVRASAIAAALHAFRSDLREMPGSFNLIYSSGVPTIVDRPAPSWFVRPIVRALRDFRQARVITVVGTMEGVPEQDFAEVGRLLGRVSSAMLVATGRATDGYQWQLLREGAFRNDVPPVFLPFPTEQAAYRKAVAMSRPADTIYFLSASPEQLHHLLPAKQPPERAESSSNGNHAPAN
jgi:cyanophycin synthetase